MEIAKLHDLLAAPVPVEVELPSGKGVVFVRHLSRREVVDYRARTFEDDHVAEGYLLSACLAEPGMSQDEAMRWREVASDDDIKVVMEKIMLLSGYSRQAAKETYKSAGDD